MPIVDGAGVTAGFYKIACVIPRCLGASSFAESKSRSRLLTAPRWGWVDIVIRSSVAVSADGVDPEAANAHAS